MASMRDAMRRLNIIYEACAPEAIASAAAEKDMDDFTRLKKKVNRDVKDLRRGLKEREELISRHGTSSETAEASYHLRVMIKALKVDVERMVEYLAKDEKRKKKKLEDEELSIRREIVALCHQHIAECEDLEKRRFLEKLGVDRAELMDGGSGDGEPRRPYGKEAPVETNENRRALFEGGNKKKGGAATSKKNAEPDPFATELRDIDVEEDFKEMNQRNEIIDQDLKDIGTGVTRLKEIAQDMNRELDVQNDQLRDLEKGVDKVLDQVDNINIKLKRVTDTMMTGDRFMINCILICVILALVVFISSIFTS